MLDFLNGRSRFDWAPYREPIRTVVRALALLIAVLLVDARPAAAEEGTPRRPNVLFVLADDLGYMDIGANNPDTFYDTPNLDRLARSGMRLTDAYAAAPVCSPTRASILTGKYPARTKTTEYFCGRRAEKLLPAKYQCRLPLAEVTLAEALHEVGYATMFAGKWHLGDKPAFWPEHQGFDVNRGGHDRGGPYGGKKYFSPYGNPRLTDGPAGEHLPDRLATETVKFIQQHRAQPFLAYLSFYSVHTPLMGREDLVKKYQAKREGLTHDGPLWKPERKHKTRQYQDHAVYAAMVEALDLAVGKVLDALEQQDLAEDTIVIFFSDNGGLSTSEGSPTSNVPLRAGKGWIYEGGIREPCLIRAPGVTQPGSVCREPVVSTDFFPTILELAGLPIRPQDHVDGVSLVPLLRGQTLPDAREAIYWHYPHYGNQGGAPCGAVRQGDWKLVEWFEDGSLELFNLADDLGEQTNLAGQNPDRVAQMHQMLQAWRTSVDAQMPTPNSR